MHRLPDAERTKALSSEELRSAFLVRGLFEPGRVILRHVDLDRVVVGGAVPVETPLELAAPAWLGAEFFTERRELGVLNIGGAGRVRAGGTTFELETRDV